MAFQVTDVTIFTAESQKKNIKGRVTLSDGVSKMICMLPDKVYNMIVSIFIYLLDPLQNDVIYRKVNAKTGSQSASMTSGR